MAVTSGLLHMPVPYLEKEKGSNFLCDHQGEGFSFANLRKSMWNSGKSMRSRNTWSWSRPTPLSCHHVRRPLVYFLDYFSCGSWGGVGVAPSMGTGVTAAPPFSSVPTVSWSWPLSSCIIQHRILQNRRRERSQSQTLPTAGRPTLSTHTSLKTYSLRKLSHSLLSLTTLKLSTHWRINRLDK